MPAATICRTGPSGLSVKEWRPKAFGGIFCATIPAFQPCQSVKQRVNKKVLIDLIGIELIILVVVIGYKMSPVLLPKADVTVQPDPVCNLQRESCSVSLPAGGTLELSMGQHPIPMVKPFSLQVKASGFTPDRVEIDLAGVDMNMGYNRQELKSIGEGRFETEMTLPVCITGQMDWQATVLVERGSERIAIPYRFTSSGGHE